MGGAITEPGNITPLAEFNTYADATAAARLYALTSPTPISTMPVAPPTPNASVADPHSRAPLAAYPPANQLGERRLNLVLFPLDITQQHWLRRGELNAKLTSLAEQGSPLAEWTTVFMDAIFATMERLQKGHEGSATGMALHDPMCVWYALDRAARSTGDGWKIAPNVDLRVETAGQWSMGACVVDRRGRKQMAELQAEILGGATKVLDDPDGDMGGWLSEKRGNRLRVCEASPGPEKLGKLILSTVFGE